jgi:hypothetical protein
MPSTLRGAWDGTLASLRTAAPRSAAGGPMRLTYRTARVLEAVAELGGRGSDPSNRMVGDHAGISDQGQISKLLARLKRLGLLENGGEGSHVKGEAYAWQLTPTGRSVVQAIAVSTRYQRRAA